MRIIDAIEMRRTHQARMCEALGLDPEKTVDITINREHDRVEVKGAELDLNAHRGWYRLVMGEYPTLGLTPGNQISYEQWDAALKIENEWRAGFPTAEAGR